MGQKFTITESERNHIRGLYEQPVSGVTQPKSGEIQQPERVFNITKVMLSMKANGTITFTNDTVKCNFSFAKTNFVGEVHIDKKSVSGDVETYICSGNFMGSEKHMFNIMPSQKMITWGSANPIDGQMRAGVMLSYK